MDYQFNINQFIKIKLIPLGISYYKKRVDKIPNHLISGVSPSLALLQEIENKLDKDGYLEIQMHEFMRYFGDIASCGSDFDKYCSTIIKLNKKDLTNQSEGRSLRIKQ